MSHFRILIGSFSYSPAKINSSMLSLKVIIVIIMIDNTCAPPLL